MIEVAPGTVIAEPLHLIQLTSSPIAAAQFSRSALIAGAGASVRLAESCPAAHHAGGATASQVNDCLMVFLGEGARLAHTAMVTGTAAGGIRLETMIARLGAGAKFDSFALVSGIGLVRRQIFLRFEGRGAEASLSGVSLLGGPRTCRYDLAGRACGARLRQPRDLQIYSRRGSNRRFPRQDPCRAGRPKDRRQDAVQSHALVRHGPR